MAAMPAHTNVRSVMATTVRCSQAPPRATCTPKARNTSAVATVMTIANHAAQRRRIRTVLQEMMHKAARMIRHAGRWVLGLGASDSGFAVFDRHYGQLRTA